MENDKKKIVQKTLIDLSEYDIKPEEGSEEDCEKRPYISFGEAAERLGISKVRLSQLIITNPMPGAYKSKGGVWFIPNKELERWRENIRKPLGRPKKLKISDA